MTSDPMTREDLDEIDERLHNGDDIPHALALRLADEVDRLEQENARMRPIVEAVALRSMFSSYYPPDGASLYRCQWCHATGFNRSRFKHHAQCEVIKACAIFGIRPSESEAHADDIR